MKPFKIYIEVRGRYFEGVGNTRKEAEMDAQRKALLAFWASNGR